MERETTNMIVHTITVYGEPKTHKVFPNNKKFQGVHGTTDHRQFILKRALMSSTFTEGEYVIYKRNKAFIDSIITDFDMVGWDGLRPLFIEILNEDGKLELVHSSVLKRIK